MSLARRVRTPLIVALLVAIATLAGVVAGMRLAPADTSLVDQIKAKGYRRSGVVENAVVRAAPAAGAVVAGAASGFSTQVRLGHQSGDGWEPAVAADDHGHIYLLYAQYLGVPGCPSCKSPTQIVQSSADRGATWGPPRVIHPPGAGGGQWDSQIVVDPADGRTVYASWLQNAKSDIAVAKSTDFGATWTTTIANRINKGGDKPILAVRGRDIYVAYNHATQMYVASSHDGGATWNEVKINRNGKLGWALASGGTVTPNGDVYFSWGGYEQNGVAKGPVNLFVSRSSDGGVTWTHRVLDVSGRPADCSAYLCGWAYLGAQLVVSSDAAGTLYALWNKSTAGSDAHRVYFARSTDAGRTWSTPASVSTARLGAQHTFPAIASDRAGDVRISWMDTRHGALWNTYYRASTNGGASWSAEKDVSSYVSGYSYIKPDGFSFPFGDYYELDIDDQGTAHVVNGQALNYDSPGAVWYTRGR